MIYACVTLYFCRQFGYNFSMFKIWAKIIRDGKIINQTVYESVDKFTYSNFFTYLARQWILPRPCF